MIKLKYTEEDTFITEEIEFSDEHYELAKKLHKQFENQSPIMVKNDKKSLVFCVNLSDEFKDIYRVVIEKI